MRRLNILISIGILIVLSGMAGCNLPTTPAPICDAAHLESATITAPAMWEMVSTNTPTITWTYPNHGCLPASYDIHLEVGPDFSAEYTFSVDGSETSFTVPNPLPAATVFRVGVASVSSEGTRRGTLNINFFTGPACDDPNALLAPTLITPLGTPYDPLHDDGMMWDYPGDCHPDGYRVEISDSPDFPDIGFGGSTNHPFTLWVPSPNLTECQEYYWRVAAIMETADGQIVFGPYSEPSTFIAVNRNSQCPNVTETPTSLSSVSGVVWHDMCALPEDGSIPSPLPSGCIIDSNGKAHADGIRQAGEPGIAEVDVTLHVDDCNGALTAFTLTDANGNYHFDDLTPGAYCLRIEAGNSVNVGSLWRGQWTAPTVADDPITQPFSLAAGEASTYDFGWDYEDQPPYQTPTPSIPQLKFEGNAYCRKGPGQVYPDVTAIPSGEIVPILGRSPDNNWYYVHWDTYDVSCWVSKITGTPLGDLGNIAIMTPPPLPPTATPTPGDTTPPSITDFHALEIEAYYPSGTGCGTTQVSVTARLQDDSGIDETQTRLYYHYVSQSGDVSSWYALPIQDHAMGGQVGFFINVGDEAQATLNGQNGYVNFKIKAYDNYGNSSVSTTLSLPITHCAP